VTVSSSSIVQERPRWGREQLETETEEGEERVARAERPRTEDRATARSLSLVLGKATCRRCPWAKGCREKFLGHCGDQGIDSLGADPSPSSPHLPSVHPSVRTRSFPS
jgi:hypothetical protein